MTAHQIDVLLTVVIHRSLQAQLLVNRLVEDLAEIRHLFDELDEFLQFQTEEHGRCDGTDAHRRFLLVQQVGLAKVLTVAQECYP